MALLMSELGQPENVFPTCEKYDQLQHETLLKLGLIFHRLSRFDVVLGRQTALYNMEENRRNLKFLFLPKHELLHSQ